MFKCFVFCVSDSLPSLARYRSGGMRGTRYCPGRPVGVPKTEVPSLDTRRVERYRPPHIRRKLDARGLCPATPVCVPPAVYPFFGPTEVTRIMLDPLFFWKRSPDFFTMPVEPDLKPPNYSVSGFRVKKGNVLFKPSYIHAGSLDYSGRPREADQPQFQVQMAINVSRSDPCARTKGISVACQAEHPDTSHGRQEMLHSIMSWMQEAADEIGAPVDVDLPIFHADSRAVE